MPDASRRCRSRSCTTRRPWCGSSSASRSTRPRCSATRRSILALRTQVIPLLRTYPFVRIWHAGCSTGEEVYSLAILLHEEGLYERCRIYATDLSDGVARAGAQAASFRCATMRDYTVALSEGGRAARTSRSYYTDRRTATPCCASALRQEHRLLAAQPGVRRRFNEFHLILCRNVMIYFDQTLRERVHQLLHREPEHVRVPGRRQEGVDPEHTPSKTASSSSSQAVSLYRRLR